MNPLLSLKKENQSVWCDFITRRFMAEGKLEALIAEDGITGVTSNPAIFKNAITGGREYDGAIGKLLQEGKSAAAIFESLAVEDIRQACDLFRPVYDATQGADGYVSLEVNPHLARDAQGTLEEARHLYRAVNRRNLMIKIPATQEGLPAIEEALGEGININVTLIFALKRYEEVMNAWLAGLERLQRAGKPLSTVSSVASFFVSRVDTLVDGRLEKRRRPHPHPLPEGRGGSEINALMGKAAIANAQLAYDLFLQMKSGARWRALAKAGARVQRPLWASTSTKNPAYRDVIYVEELIGAETVNTLPLPTLEAFRDHGSVKKALPAPADAARAVVSAIEAAGLSMESVTRQLEEDGLKLFVDAYDDLIISIEKKRETLKAGV